jgi:hypothetical protein
MFDRVQVRAPTGSLKDIQRLVLKPLLRCLGCVLRVVVLLEGEPAPQSEVLSTLEQVFINDLCTAPFIFPSILTSLPVSAAEKHRHSMMLPPTDVTLGIQDKVQSSFHQTRSSCFSWSDSPLGALWQNRRGLSCAFFWGGASVWPLYHKGLISGVLQRWLSFWMVLSSHQRNSRALSAWPLGSCSPPWPRLFSPDCSVWPGGQL